MSAELQDDDSIMALQALMKIKKSKSISVQQENIKFHSTDASIDNDSLIHPYEVNMPSHSRVHDDDAIFSTSEVKPMVITSSLPSVSRKVSQEQSLHLINKSPSRGDTPTLKSENDEGQIRKEIIAAALLSKPQRGRKRDNLNVFERMELTRTRNREHAKSTRYAIIRKDDSLSRLCCCI
jgi:hypothetical protein